MTAHVQIRRTRPGLEEREPEQTTGQRHRVALNRGADLARFPFRLARRAHVEDVDLDVCIVKRLLKHLTVKFDERGPQRLGLGHHAADGPLQGLAFYATVNIYEKSDLPVRFRTATGFLRKPNVQLCACHRRNCVAQTHPYPRIETVAYDVR
jgi:hypothetical protein